MAQGRDQHQERRCQHARHPPQARRGREGGHEQRDAKRHHERHIQRPQLQGESGGHPGQEIAPGLGATEPVANPRAGPRCGPARGPLPTEKDRQHGREEGGALDQQLILVIRQRRVGAGQDAGEESGERAVPAPREHRGEPGAHHPTQHLQREHDLEPWPRKPVQLADEEGVGRRLVVDGRPQPLAAHDLQGASVVVGGIHQRRPPVRVGVDLGDVEEPETRRQQHDQHQEAAPPARRFLQHASEHGVGSSQPRIRPARSAGSRSAVGRSPSSAAPVRRPADWLLPSAPPGRAMHRPRCVPCAIPDAP